MPASSCYLIDYPISTRYRGGHPRTYLPSGPIGGLSDSAHWSSGVIATLQTGWRTFIGLLYSSTYTSFSAASQVCVSYVNKVINPVKPYRRTTPLVYAITQNTATVKLEVASQRRRIGRK